MTTVTDEILEKHLDSSEVTELLEWAGSLTRLLEPAKKKVFLSTVAEGTRNDYVRAWALFKMSGRIGRDASEEDKAKHAEVIG